MFCLLPSPLLSPPLLCSPLALRLSDLQAPVCSEVERNTSRIERVRKREKERERERGREGAEERREGEWSGTIMTAFTTAGLRVISPKGCAFKSMLEDAVITVQNSAARLLTKTKRCDHTTLVLASLHLMI